MTRRFRSNTGRMWSVRLARADYIAIEREPSATSARVLRFTSPDGLTCDLEDYPSDWERFTETGLLSLLGRAMTDWVSTGR